MKSIGMIGGFQAGSFPPGDNRRNENTDRSFRPWATRRSRRLWRWSLILTFFFFTLTLVFFTLPLSFSLQADEQVLHGDFRQRPPEMVIQGKNLSGPLKEIIEEAAQKIGFIVQWRIAPFARSLNALKDGKVDIVPRTLRNEKRESFVHYLGPIGYQQKDILFLVNRGEENRIKAYEDLKGLTIGVKRETAYFTRFDEDTALQKEKSIDDANMVKMFKADRFDTMAVLDKTSLERALAKAHIGDHAYAAYRHSQILGNYYGLSKRSPRAGIYPRLNRVLLSMTASGRVADIYRKYGIAPPMGK
ncbi:MAG: transporter substrate-binding domain-containing protein [Desulfobacteraceae bacterium]